MGKEGKRRAGKEREEKENGWKKGWKGRKEGRKEGRK